MTECKISVAIKAYDAEGKHLMTYDSLFPPKIGHSIHIGSSKYCIVKIKNLMPDFKVVVEEVANG